jgi:hypothetical protein
VDDLVVDDGVLLLSLLIVDQDESSFQGCIYIYDLM